MTKQTTHKTKHYHIRSKDREYFTSNLALLLKAGVAVGEAFESLKLSSKSKSLQRALVQMQQDVDDGLPLWKALQNSGIASSQTLALVQLGEESGNLTENLRVAASQEEKQRTFKSKIRSALMYPAFVIGITVVVGLGVAWFLLPKLADTFAQLKVSLPPISQVFLSFGRFLQADGIWAVPAIIVGLLVTIYVLFIAPPTKQIGQGLLRHVPGVGGLLGEVEISRFGYLLGTLLNAGLSVTQAIELLTRATDSRPYKKFYVHLRSSLDDGLSFKDSMPAYKHSDKLLPPAVQQMVMAGERSGALPETLQSIGNIYEAKADITTQNLEAVLEPILLVIVAAGVLGVAVAVILPIYSLVGNLGGV